MEKKASASSWPWAAGVPLGMRIKESYKEYALPGFAFGSVVSFMHHRLSRNPGALVRHGAGAALRTGMTAAFRTPLFVLMERSLAARRGQSDWVSFYGGVLGSYFPCRIWPALMVALAGPGNLGVSLLFAVLPIPATPNTQVAVGAQGACGFLYWWFLWSLMQDTKSA